MLAINGLDWCFSPGITTHRGASDEAGVHTLWRGTSRCEQDICGKNYNLKIRSSIECLRICLRLLSTSHSLLVSGRDRVTINFVSKIHTNSIFLILTECAAMTIPNKASDRVTRMKQARDFLKGHPVESVTTASRIFKVSRSTLSGLISGGLQVGEVIGIEF
jgi:hypothetical protein